MPHRISEEYVQSEHDAFVSAGAEEEFRMERLSIWPAATQIGSLISVAEWDAAKLTTIGVPDDGEISAGVAISPDRKWASVAFAWKVGDKVYIDVAQHAVDTDWLLPYLADVVERRGIKSVAVDQGGPGATMLPAMGAARLPVRVTDTAAYKVACATFVDAVRHGKLRHRGQPELTEAANGVREHRVGDSWVFARRDSGVVIAPLEAATLAVWGLTPEPSKKEFFMQDLNAF
jgi:hypothetical protein